MATTLIDHRTKLKNNPCAYSHDISRCYETVVKHLKDAGYKRITYLRAKGLVEKYVNFIFDAQGNKPFFHIVTENGLPFCWNSPSKGGWDIDYIKYEWGHLSSWNQNGDAAFCIKNLCLQSARCNQHIQSSMNVEELLAYDGKLREVIELNISKRNYLFESEPWLALEKELAQWKL